MGWGWRLFLLTAVSVKKKNNSEVEFDLGGVLVVIFAQTEN